MIGDHPLDSSFDVYRQVFRVHVHQLIAWGYEDSRSQIQPPNLEETHITGYIAEAIKERLRAPDCPNWCNQYFVNDDPPIPAPGKGGRSRPRPDIVIESNFKSRPEFYFEAKRLRENGFGEGKYTGAEGMGCFISGLYASRYDEVAMLGYVQSGTTSEWKRKVKAKIDKGAKALRLIPSQQEAKIIGAFSEEWASAHERNNLTRSITIYHILLQCI